MNIISYISYLNIKTLYYGRKGISKRNYKLPKHLR
jgi:hypothetical protein